MTLESAHRFQLQNVCCERKSVGKSQTSSIQTCQCHLSGNRSYYRSTALLENTSDQYFATLASNARPEAERDLAAIHHILDWCSTTVLKLSRLNWSVA